MYVKLVEGNIIEAPETLVLEDGTTIQQFNRNIKNMLNHGFKPLIDTKPIYNIDTQYCNIVKYKDMGRYITCEWEVMDIEISEAELQNQETQKAMEMLNMDFNEQIQTLSDEMALEVPTVFPKWQVDINYKKDFKVRHKDILYKVLQDHLSQITWAPDVTPSLFTKVLVNTDGNILEWEQPDSTNPYMKGDKVKHNGIIYESLIDNNIWNPVDYPQGWKTI